MPRDARPEAAATCHTVEAALRTGERWQGGGKVAWATPCSAQLPAAGGDRDTAAPLHEHDPLLRHS